MDYRFARAFLVTADFKSFSKAAIKLRVAQSAISRQIRLLEQSVGFQLFFRSNKEVRLTERGEQLFHRLRDFDQWFQHQYNDEPTELKIAALDGLMDSFVIPRLSRSNLSPNLKLQLTASKHDEIERLIKSGGIDIAMTYLPIRSNGYACRNLFEQTMVLISSKPFKSSDLSKERWIHMGRAEYLRKSIPRSEKADIIINSLPGLIKLVKSGAGIAIVPDSYVSDTKEIHRKPLTDKSKIYLIARDFTIAPDDFKKILIALQK